MLRETTQALSGRSFEWTDWLADLGGAASACAGFVLLQGGCAW